METAATWYVSGFTVKIFCRGYTLKKKLCKPDGVGGGGMQAKNDWG